MSDSLILELRKGSDGRVTTKLDAAAYPDSRMWGIAIADVIRHVARAYSMLGAGPESGVAESVLEFVNREFENPTSDLEGGLQQ